MNSLSKPIISTTSALTLDLHQQINELEARIAQANHVPENTKLILKGTEEYEIDPYDNLQEPLYFLALRRFKGEEHLVGFIRLFFHASHFYVTHLAVHPDWSGRGISSRLVQAVFSHFNQKALPSTSF